ncbi:MAG: PatB family C-S lyase [Rikenellaceae bacterium]|nr:PatB family C-S lyase [Rikenellaceae bacterium]
MGKKYDFDKLIDRRGTGAIKTDSLKALYGRDDVLPMWVADMDIETPDFILDAIKLRMEHPIFGYTRISPNYTDSIIKWNEKIHGWSLRKDWITFIPGVVKGIAMVINYFTRRGDKVIIQPPVYHPFRITTEKNGRVVVNNPLKLVDGQYRMDFGQLESVIDDKCKLLILSNPHNPGGRVWDRDTLIRLADICYKNNILVISDEIHSDLALFGNRHIPFATVSEEARKNSITFAAPSKTFNIAGIVSSYAVVPDDRLRHEFYEWLDANELSDPSIFSAIAAEAAFTYGYEWREQMLAYISKNIEYVSDYIGKNIPAIKVIRPEASFLVWLDCRGLGLDHGPLVSLFVNGARLGLNDGEMFGPGGEGFMRMNIGTPLANIRQAMEQLRAAMDSTQN